LIGVALAGCSINPGSLTPCEPQSASSPFGSNIALLTKRHQPRRANNKRGAMPAQAGKADEALADCNKAISLGANLRRGLCETSL